MSLSARILGFAFTNADFLFEMDTEGTILFAAGAANDLVKEAVKTWWQARRPTVPAVGRQQVCQLRQGAEKWRPRRPFHTDPGYGRRRQPRHVPAAGKRRQYLLYSGAPRHRDPRAHVDPKTGLASRDDFMAVVEKAGDRDALTLVNMPDLPELCAQLSPDGADELLLHRR